MLTLFLLFLLMWIVILWLVFENKKQRGKIKGWTFYKFLTTKELIEDVEEEKGEAPEAGKKTKRGCNNTRRRG